MPSHRKRIGFLPRSEVQNIIDKICINNKLSQSKVTGILVDHALNSIGLLKGSITRLSLNFKSDNDKSLLINNEKFVIDRDNENDYLIDESYIKEEVKMINDFIEFKLFKNMVNKNKYKI